MAFLHVVSRQPSAKVRTVNSPEHRGYTNFSDGEKEDKMTLHDLDGRTLTEAEMTYEPLKGCEDLENVQQLFIRQNMRKDLKAGCGAGNTYTLSDGDQRTIFTAVEDSNCCCRWTCGPARMYHITIYNTRDEPVLHLDRACCRCDWCCCADCCFCQHKLIMRDWRGQIVGSARQKFHVFHLKMDVRDADDKPFCRIRGPCCPCRCCYDINFDIVSLNGNKPLGYIYKQFDGYRDDVNIDHELFELYYPRGLELKQKINLLGAAFLVDFMYFEMS